MRKFQKESRLITTIFVLVGLLVVGYATLGANLKINGVSTIPASSWNVKFKDNSINVTTGSVAIDTTNNEQAARIDDNSNVSYKVRLALPGDFYEFTVIVENTGSIDAMIDSVSSKLGTTEITSGTLPSYLTYSVTYSDGVTIAPHHLLAASTEETFKVRIEFKKDIQASQLPSSATTLNLNFQINYVQADSTAVVVNHPFTGTMYGVYPEANQLTLNSAVPANAILHSTPSEALADWTNPSVMNKASQKPYYLKHKIENDIVTESYLVFTITPEMATANPGLVSGTYELRGEKTYENGAYIVGEDYISPYYETNKETIKTAFGYSTNPSRCTEEGTGRTSRFACTVYGLRANAFVIGAANANDGNLICYVSEAGVSSCG